jgi:hypothetical protein
MLKAPPAPSDRFSSRTVVEARAARGVVMGALVGALASLGALGLRATGAIWPRVFVAHAWNLGARASKSIEAPNTFVLVGVVFATGFVLGFLGSKAFQPSRRSEKERTRVLALNLILLYAVAIAILAFYPAIAGSIGEAVSGDGAVGPEYPVVFAIRLLPGAACYLILGTLAAHFTHRRAPERIGAVLFLAWIGLAFVTLASIAWYFSPGGPTPP